MEEHALAFKATLRSLIAKSGVTHAELSESASTANLRISSSAVSAWASDKMPTTPSVPQLAALADYFDVTTDFLVGRSSSQSSLPPNCWLLDLDYIDAVKRGEEPPDPEERPAFAIPPRTKVVTSRQWESLQRELQRLSRRTT